MPIDFPDNPTNGDTFTSGGRTWEFSNGSWSAKMATPSVASGSITVDKLADDAVHTAKIASGAVTTAKIAAGSITATELGTGSVTAGKIDSLAVTNAKLAAEAVTEGKIATGAVSANKIAAGAVVEAGLGTGAVTVNKIGSGAVTTAKISAGAVTTTELGANAVTQAKMASTISAVTICTSTTRPASPFDGQTIYESDTTRILIWSNSAWVGIAKANNVTVNSSGVISGTQQPRFLATRSGDTSYTGGNDIIFNTAVYNIGSHYSTTTGLFTAPVAGTYIFDVGVYQSAAIQQIWFRVNGNRERSFQLDHTGGSANMAGQGIIFLNAGDTLGVASWSNGATVTMYANFHHNYFRGCFVS